MRQRRAAWLKGVAESGVSGVDGSSARPHATFTVFASAQRPGGR
jgi:hypothetical protein